MDVVSLNIFPTAVHIIKTKRWAEYKNFFIATIKDQKDPAYRPKEGFYTDYDLDQPWLKVVWGEFIVPEIKVFLDQTHTKLQDIWAQEYVGEADHSAHRHQIVGYSCVFYATFDPKHHTGTTIFRPFVDPNDYTNSNDIFTPEVEEGDLLVFPSWMLHMVKPRRVIAFNLIPK